MAITEQKQKNIAVIGVIANGESLARKIQLLLGYGYTVTQITSEADARCDIAVKAIYKDEIPTEVRIIRDSISTTLSYPFAFDEFRAAFAKVMSGKTATERRLLIESDGRHIILDGERIRLTESEHKLLSLIAEGKGELVSREELTTGAFGEGADGGILNVYIHYLREKLEGTGEKIILSSRRGGYRIDKKYLGGER